ncbi:MAG: YggT family protein, partial [Chloroflexi bacterium]|nr:YggT family protein [Chloroflexota bacterium]
MKVAYYFIVVLARVLNIAILIRVFLSWMPINPGNRFARFIIEITEPIMGPIRRLVPSIGGLDISPIIALLIVSVAERVLLTL